MEDNAQKNTEQDAQRLWGDFLGKARISEDYVIRTKESDFEQEMDKHGYTGVEKTKIRVQWEALKDKRGKEKDKEEKHKEEKDKEKAQKEKKENKLLMAESMRNVPSYHTTTEDKLLRLQQQRAGKLLIAPFPPSTQDTYSFLPLYMPPLEEHHKQLLLKLLSGSVMIYNVSGAGKTKLAYSLVLEEQWDPAGPPPIVILITVGVIKEDKHDLTHMFKMVVQFCKEEVQRALLGPTSDVLRRMHERVIHCFRCVELAYLLLLRQFCALFQDKDARERWLRYQVNGGNAVAASLFSMLIKQSTFDVMKKYSKVVAILRVKYNVVFFYDEAGALVNKVQGCCLHKGLADTQLHTDAVTEWELETTGVAAKDHVYATDLLYAMRESFVGLNDTFHAIADADDVIMRQLSKEERSGTLPLEPFSSFTTMGTPLMHAILRGLVAIPTPSSPVIIRLQLQLDFALAYFVGRARHFYDYYLPTVWRAMVKDPPRDGEELLRLLLRCAEDEKKALLSKFKHLLNVYMNDTRVLAGGISRNDLVRRCLLALCLEKGKLKCNCELVRDLITGNILVCPSQLSYDTSVSQDVDMSAEPVIQDAILEFVRENRPVESDPVFQHIFHETHSMSIADSAKGNWGDRAVAWALCRLARVGGSLGSSLENVLPGVRIPGELYNYQFASPTMTAGTQEDFGDFVAPISKGYYVFPSSDAGPDGLAQLTRLPDPEILPDSQTDEDAQTEEHTGATSTVGETGLLIVQSKVRASFDILDALYSTNPYLAYCTKADRKSLMSTGPAGVFAMSDWSSKYEHARKRDDLAKCADGVACVVRILFSASGFPADIVEQVNTWNTANPKAPVVLLSPTNELFGKHLADTLKTLAKDVAVIEGKTKLSLKIKKLDNSTSRHN